MYESHFGLSGPPFQLSPDPSFYFESKGHANALSYLKFGVFQGEGFIVVTGEIGAGKTMLVRTLLEVLNRDQVVAAQIVSTQLEAGDLLRAITVAFGIPVTGLSKSQLINSLEAFFTSLAAKKRRALLVVDEAQNLSMEAVEELRMLSNFQLGSQALLQSFFVGQPELRRMLQSPAMEQFRQRVIASCHLGPMDRVETQAYVQHRLGKAGWKGMPSFDADAFLEIHRATDGVPRRINLLCNRLLLGCYLAGSEAVSAASVRQTAAELRAEVGQQGVDRGPAAARPYVVSEQGDSVNRSSAGISPAAGHQGSGEGATAVRSAVANLVGPVLVLADSAIARMKAGVLGRAAVSHPNMPPLVVVNVEANSRASAAETGLSALPGPLLETRLEPKSAQFAAAASDMMLKFDEVIDEVKPVAVVAAGNGDAVLACGLVAAKRGVPLVRIDAGDPIGDAFAGSRFNGELLDQLADLLYSSRLTAHYLLYKSGIGSERIVHAGSLMSDLLAELLPQAVDPSVTLAQHGVSAQGFLAGPGYVLFTLPHSVFEGPVAQQAAYRAMLLGLAQEAPVICAVDADLRQRVLAWFKDGEDAMGCGVAVVATGYPGLLGLLSRARAVVSDVRHSLSSEAALIGKPVLTIGTPADDRAEEDSVGSFVGLDAKRARRSLASLIASPEIGREPLASPLKFETSNRIITHFQRWLSKSRRQSERANAEA